MYIDRNAGEFLRALMERKGYTIRQLAQVTGKQPTQIQRFRDGNVRPQEDTLAPIFALLPEFKEYLEKQQAQKLDALLASTQVPQVQENKDTDDVVDQCPSVPTFHEASLCPVVKEWQVISSEEVQTGKCPFANMSGCVLTPVPYGYSGEPSVDGLYAFQLEHNSGEPKIPYGAMVYVEWNASFEIGRLYLFVNDEQPEFGYLYRQTAIDLFRFTRFNGEEICTSMEDLRGRVIAWTVRA